MLVAALDTSTLQGTVGWVSISTDRDEFIVDGFAECTAPVRPGHAETLIDRLKTILSHGGFNLDDADLLVFGRGPGTFTGLRIGLSTVKGIAIARNCPIIGISSLEASALSACVPGRVATVVDAKRGEFFFGLYDIEVESGIPSASEVVDEWVGPIESIFDKIEKNIGDKGLSLAGEGAVTHGDELLSRFGNSLKILPPRSWTVSAYWMAVVGYHRFLARGPDDIDSCVPNYLREPDAKLPGDR